MALNPRSYAGSRPSDEPASLDRRDVGRGHSPSSNTTSPRASTLHTKGADTARVDVRPLRSCSGASVRPVDLEQLERRLRERLDALGPAPRAELLHVLMLPDFERADRIGEFWSYPESRTFAELLIDCEEDRTLRAVLVGMLRGDEKPRRKATSATPVGN